ncbi:bile acid:sodium symporter family protein [Glycomyces sp. A-F 0318]|uniref:bile acid:sodium symporter family protein n=1 Tax=Glycomyces amatae TaxID=2881355 RepID=UPI001E4FB44B|nr:bile acid:sodium symporter family protein [Glycomyces amatae]MCD0442732.1 bile acid:sodium symporter family protein [Glycomyces amatae]
MIKRVSDLTGTWLPAIVLVAAAVAFATPSTFAPLGAAVPYLLMVIMLGMGMTLRPVDFAVIGRRPWPVVLGVVAQFLVMPLAGYGLARAFDMEPMLAVGMVLVGAAPGGTASNVMVYLSKGDTALSVAMTSISTLLAPLLTPVLVLWLAGEFLPVDAGDLFVSIVQIVLVPVVVGLLLRRFAPRLIDRVLDALPLVSVLGITLVVMAVVAGSADTLLEVGALVAVAVVLHNAFGLALGYGLARLCRLPATGRRAVSIEVGMQNSGLAAALATTHFNPVAALPAAVFSVWHNISGSLIAAYWSRRPVADAPEPNEDRDPAEA